MKINYCKANGVHKVMVLGILSLVVFNFFALQTVAAVTPATYTPLVTLPGVPQPSGGDFSPYVNGLVKITIGIAAVLAVIYIVIGGIQYMSTDAVSAKSEGKEHIMHALQGLFLVIIAYLILYTINPNLLKFILNPS